VSAALLQRVVVRMLFDPAFCDRVYADPVAALLDVELTSEERQWLVAPDRRAYGVDVHRRSRALTGLLEEYPVCGALAVRCLRGVQRLHGFFATDIFHQCIQQRGSMADAFGTYLASEVFANQPESAHLAAVERGIARVRRAPHLPDEPTSPLTDDTCLCLAPWAVLLEVLPSTLERYSQLRDHLAHRGSLLLETVLDTAYQLPVASPLGQTEVTFVLVVNVPGDDGPSLEPTSHELGTLLTAAQGTIRCRELCAVAVRLGAEPHEAIDILQGFVTDRLLICCR
jgi:hypothetical protein